MTAAYGWQIDYVLDLTVPQILLLLKCKDQRERSRMLWETQIAAASMFALSPKEGAEYLERVREILEGGADAGWRVPAAIPRLEDTTRARTPRGRPLPIKVVQIAPEEMAKVEPVK